jgi:hypothetical protein
LSWFLLYNLCSSGLVTMVTGIFIASALARIARLRDLRHEASQTCLFVSPYPNSTRKLSSNWTSNRCSVISYNTDLKPLSPPSSSKTHSLCISRLPADRAAATEAMPVMHSPVMAWGCLAAADLTFPYPARDLVWIHRTVRCRNRGNVFAHGGKCVFVIIGREVLVGNDVK